MHFGTGVLKRDETFFFLEFKLILTEADHAFLLLRFLMISSDIPPENIGGSVLYTAYVYNRVSILHIRLNFRFTQVLKVFFSVTFYYLCLRSLAGNNSPLSHSRSL